MARVIIENPKTHEHYSIEKADFTKKAVHPDGSYEERGFRIIANEDGSPYEEPKREEPKRKAD